MEERIIELEKIVAYQANEIDEMTQVVNGHEKKISTLENEIKILTEKMGNESLVRPIEEEDPPPHY